MDIGDENMLNQMNTDSDSCTPHNIHFIAIPIKYVFTIAVRFSYH